MKKTYLSWSSGKDSAWALYQLQQNPNIDIVGLFTTINEKYNRAAMHGTRVEMLQRQADAAGLPIEIIKLPDVCSNEEYESIIGSFIEDVQKKGIECIAFGDLFLEDIRNYRKRQLKKTKIEPLFPLWKIPTDNLAKQMLESNLEAYISCVDKKKVPKAVAGKKWSQAILNELSKDVDPCGENGEFHTIVVNGPMFKNSIPISVGEIVEKEGFVFADIIPKNSY